MLRAIDQHLCTPRIDCLRLLSSRAAVIRLGPALGGLITTAIYYYCCRVYRLRGLAALDHTEAREVRDVCAICLSAPREPATTQCGHTFCMSCLRAWFETSVHATDGDVFGATARCPMCMTRVLQLSTAERAFVRPTLEQQRQADAEIASRLRQMVAAFAAHVPEPISKERNVENDARRSALNPPANALVGDLGVPTEVGARIVISNRGIHKIFKKQLRRLISGEATAQEAADAMFATFLKFRSYAMPLPGAPHQ